MVTGGPCVLDFSFSPEVEWALTSHQRVLVVLLASPFHKRRFLRVASRKARLGCGRGDVELDGSGDGGDEGLKQMVAQLELAWEQRDQPSSSRYISLEDVVREEEAVGEGEVEGEDLEMSEDRVWSPNSSDRAALALFPDAPSFPVQ
ncbi:hypothetical protein BDM02DRAFT_3133476 [Thelephora ganbajun]|uniref:Uncharacterized protein n=1 Tax=Thelephora ganbajun TaxID=370292 RepID=A0ACB6YXB4_THEGA|nr:hypothetical protein BDM02DRAFT_3133476 [Thelephora ganbajun]